MSIVQQLTTSLDDAVNYQEFLKLLDKAKNISISDEFSHDTSSPHLMNAMREQIHGRINALGHQDREVVERLRSQVKQSNADIGRVFNRFA